MSLKILVHLELQKVTLFENKVFADISNQGKDLDEIILDRALNPITGLFLRKKEDTERLQRCREAGGDEKSEAEIPAMQPKVKEPYELPR